MFSASLPLLSPTLTVDGDDDRERPATWHGLLSDIDRQPDSTASCHAGAGAGGEFFFNYSVLPFLFSLSLQRRVEGGAGVSDEAGCGKGVEDRPA